jgi:hypothetical protein
MNNPSGDRDEITFDPLPMPRIPVPRAVAAIAGRVRHLWLARSQRRLTRRGWLLAAIAAVVVIGALSLANVIWMSTPPPWASALGAGVTVTGPGQAVPGHGSPGAALTGFLAALPSNDPAASCDYTYSTYPAALERCMAELSQTPRNQMPYTKSIKIGYVAIDGTRALVGFTGTICSPAATPECVANTDPARIFSTRQSFATLWARTVNPSSANTYALLPCVEVGGKWYVGLGVAGNSS